MDVGWLCVLIVVLIVLILYICFDINYFVTCMLISLWCKLRRKRVRVNGTTEYYDVPPVIKSLTHIPLKSMQFQEDVYWWLHQMVCPFQKKITLYNVQNINNLGVCTTNDLDIYLQHINNARYVRELDFAKIHFYKRTGIFDILWAQKGKALQTSIYTRYRASLKLFTSYKIATRAAFWDEKCIYFEHKFIRLSDAFVTTVVFCKQTLVGVNVIEMMDKLLENRDEICKPEVPPELEEFINLDKKSSERLNKSNELMKT